MLLMLVLMPMAAIAADRRFDGFAYASGNGELQYRESHHLDFDDAGVLAERIVVYACPDGRPFARKQLDYRQSPEAPVFAMEDARLGYREGLRLSATGANFEVFSRAASDAIEQRTTVSVSGLVADAGFDRFLKSRWQRVLAGQSLPLKFLIPSMQKAIDFEVRLVDETTLAGRDAVRVRLSLGRWWGFLVPGIDATYSRDGNELLRFEGISNIRDSDGENLRVRIEFPEDSRMTVAQIDRDALLGLPLTTSCDTSLRPNLAMSHP